jgi:hypothetical protein
MCTAVCMHLGHAAVDKCSVVRSSMCWRWRGGILNAAGAVLDCASARCCLLSRPSRGAHVPRMYILQSLFQGLAMHACNAHSRAPHASHSAVPARHLRCAVVMCARQSSTRDRTPRTQVSPLAADDALVKHAMCLNARHRLAQEAGASAAAALLVFNRHSISYPVVRSDSEV